MFLYRMLNPVTHALTPEDVATYKVEPYVIAADVYTAEGHLGRGGWTWYTGSASWLYRVGLEAILGFTKRAETLEINPCVPHDWKEFSIEYRHGDSTYTITVQQPQWRSEGSCVSQCRRCCSERPDSAGERRPASRGNRDDGDYSDASVSGVIAGPFTTFP